VTPSQEDDGSDIKAGQARNFDGLHDVLAETPFGRHHRFWNFGYRPLDGETTSGPRLGAAFPNRESAQLLFEVVGDVDLTGARVAEIGCGRGGNLWLLHRYYDVAHVVGVDIAYKPLTFGRSSIPESAAFVNGDAERVPLGDEVVDAVVSVETSCTYPDVESFLRHVARILVPGGHFLYADLLRTELIEPYVAALGALGLELTASRDITLNVESSRRSRAERQRLAFGEAEAVDGAALDEFAGQEGSRLFAYLHGGGCRYQAMRLTKTGEVTATDAPLLTPDQQAVVRAQAAASMELLTLSPAAP
jgi:SAM-dependent methyltransferase